MPLQIGTLGRTRTDMLLQATALKAVVSTIPPPGHASTKVCPLKLSFRLVGYFEKGQNLAC